MLTLTEDDLFEITGYHRPTEQLSELHRQGYHRATRPRNGPVVLTRAHFEAVQGSRPELQIDQAQNAAAGPNVVGLAAWTSKRGSSGQKTQRR